ncbi:hypothetical protein [Bacteriovorax sp. BSW11_IV]|uniref:hypothetical protein n=1 Tax=Bacteriovorax sp. BSW11_IV TaxID=1353529 RepID=UPI0003F9CF81|nr:hypothetical protein [Bacteriovorax sp. BSW11_IV]
MTKLSDKLIWNNDFDLLVRKLLDSLNIGESATLWQNNGQKRITAEGRIESIDPEKREIFITHTSENAKLFNPNDFLYFHCPRTGLLFKTSLITSEENNSLTAKLPDNYRMLELRLETRLAVAPQIIRALMDVSFSSYEEEVEFDVIDISPSGLGLLLLSRQNEYFVGQKLFLKKIGDFGFDYVMPSEIAHLTPIRDFSAENDGKIHMGLRFIGELPAEILFDLIEI